MTDEINEFLILNHSFNNMITNYELRTINYELMCVCSEKLIPNS